MAARFLCGVPKDDCCGGMVQCNKSLGSSIKAHGTTQQAWECYKQYLLKQGYVQIGNREFHKEGEAIMVLTKKSHFGARLRPGKKDEKGGSASKTRFVPTCIGKHPKAGIVVG